MKNATKQELIDVKETIRNLFAEGELPYVIHLGGGNENELIEIFKGIEDEDFVFASHRAHYHYMLKGGSAVDLVDAVRRGESMHLFRKDLNFLTSSILAGNCAVAAGVAWALKEQKSDAKVWVFIGDGAEDEGAFYEAANFVEGWNLPCTFIIEDNGKSVDTSKDRRRGPHWDINIGEGLRERWVGYKHVRRYHYTFTEPHCGPGLKQTVTFKPEVIARYLESKP